MRSQCRYPSADPIRGITVMLDGKTVIGAGSFSLELLENIEHHRRTIIAIGMHVNLIARISIAARSLLERRRLRDPDTLMPVDIARRRYLHQL